MPRSETNPEREAVPARTFHQETSATESRKGERGPTPHATPEVPQNPGPGSQKTTVEPGPQTTAPITKTSAGIDLDHPKNQRQR